MGAEMLRCAQHGRAIHQPRYRHLRLFRLLSPLQHLMSFSEFDACSTTPAIARFKRLIRTSKKHVHNKSIVVLKNSAQNGRYVAPIQSFIEKVSNSYDFPSRIGSTICKSKSMKCLTTSMHGGGGFRLGLLRRDRCHAQLHAFFHSPKEADHGREGTH